MNKIGKRIVMTVLVFAAGSLLWKVLAQTQTCTTGNVNFTEDFFSKTVTDPRDSTKLVGKFEDYTYTSVYGWPPSPIKLNQVGQNFSFASPQSMGAPIYCVGQGDLNGDGYPDLVGLKLTGASGHRQDTSQLELIWNTYLSSGGHTNYTLDPVTDHTPIESFGTYIAPGTIVVGDFNGDGLQDFFFMRNGADEMAGWTNFLACLYINCGTKTAPKFYAHTDSRNVNFTAAFQNALDSQGNRGIYLDWTSNHLFAVDIDKDGDLDLLVASQDKIWLVRNPGTAGSTPAWKTVSNWGINELSYDQRTGFKGTGGSGSAYPDGYTDRGTSCIVAGDFNLDGNVDIICGTVNTAHYLAYYTNDGTGHFTFHQISIPDSRCYGPTGLAATDFNNDGRIDIFAAGDAWNNPNQQGYLWILGNTGTNGNLINWQFQCLNACGPYPWGQDDDMVVPVDFNHDGLMDVLLSDANDSGNYYLVVNSMAPFYVLYGQAQSTNITTDATPPIDPDLQAVTRIRVVTLTQSWTGKSNSGLTVSLYFSNNGGAAWELYGTYAGSQITTINNGASVPDTDHSWYDFHNFGSDVRFKLVLTATDDNISGFPNCSYDTPTISNLTVQYQYVYKQEYSRSSAATSITTSTSSSGTVMKELLIGTSFVYPGWQGQLRAYDVTNVSFQGGPYSALNTVTTSNLDVSSGRNLYSGTTILWDAGQILQTTSPASRTIYTATRANKILTNPLVRMNFTAANATALSQFLQDTNNDSAGLINFIRGQGFGAGSNWKLGDINHSTPLIVGPPNKDPVLMGSGYAAFLAANASRAKVLYVGANDGMLHCFDVTTGAELWGFIPYNLLPKLTSQWPVDSVNQTRYYAHASFVDGSPSVADVYFSGNWHTVLLCGQGPGKGSTIDGAYNYYFALDITDPTNPQPLWEFTHKDSGGNYTTGETWSVPAIGQVNVSGSPTWLAFMGSGYDNITSGTVPGNTKVGKNFYAVRISDGTLIKTLTVTNYDTTKITKPSTAYAYKDIPDAIVASPTALDPDSDNLTEAVYVPDLDGRLYKLDVTNSNPSTWTLSTLYQDYLYYPIITKPAVWLDALTSSPVPRILFGTGGDDAAPATGKYAFISLIDNTPKSSAAVEWYIGDPTSLHLSATLQVGDKVNGLGTGYKVWADPVISDAIIYFSTLPGSIEAVNPCTNLTGSGNLYARYLRAGTGFAVGGTAFQSSATVYPEYLAMLSKARRAVTVGDVQNFTGGINKREVFAQQYNSAIQMLEQKVAAGVLIKSWREIYQVIR